MLGKIEMEDREGTCKYCGQMMWVKAADQVDANEKASEKCECRGHEKAVRYENAKAYINEICGEQAVERMLNVETIEGLCYLARLLNEEHIDSVAITVGAAKIAMKMTSEDKIKITRLDQRRHTKEV